MIRNVSNETPKKRGAGYLTEAQEQEALSKLTRPDARALFQFLISTGLRISEALIVEVQDINHGSTRLVGKGGKVRTVHYSPELIRQIRPYLEHLQGELKGKSSRLFPFSRQTANRILEPAGVYPHLLRHTYLTRLLRQTNNIRLVQEVAGHRDIKTTARYTHFTDEEIRQAMTAPRTIREKIRRVVLSLFRW